MHEPEHWLALHAPLGHGTAASQSPVAAQVCTPVPMHWVLPGMHEPVHRPLTQAWFVQATAVPQVPVPSHVWTPSVVHWPVPFAHTPVHAPFTHVCMPQSDEGPHFPFMLQVWTPLALSHCVALGVHGALASAPVPDSASSPVAPGLGRAVGVGLGDRRVARRDPSSRPSRRCPVWPASWAEGGRGRPAAARGEDDSREQEGRGNTVSRT